MANYTVRDNTRQIDVAITGGPGNESWTVTAAPPFTNQHFTETGSGSKTLTGPIIDGREYEITVDPISGYTFPPVSNVTAGVSTQTFNVTMSAEGNTGDLSIVLSPDFGQGWTVTGPSYPQGFSGSGSTSTPLTVTQGQYQISYDDDRIQLISPPSESKALGAAATFTGTYTIRDSFEVNVSVLDDGGTPTGSFGNWDITNDEGFGFTATGDWDTNNAPVTPSLGDFFEGRAYTLDFTDEVGYTPLPNQAITVAGTYEGNYQAPTSGACDLFTPEVTIAADTWSPAQALTPSSATTATADFYLKPSTLNQGCMIGFAKNTPIWDYSDCLAMIRFNEDGSSRIDVLNGNTHCGEGGSPACTTSYNYLPDHWYHFIVNFDITNKTYTVQVEDCNDGLVVLMQTASFRTGISPNDDAIGYWALRGGHNTDVLGEYGMQWDAEGTTPPTTGTISINVTPESGNWTLNGPNFYQVIDTGDRTLTGLAFGDYTITYGDISGYTKPSNDSATLSSGSPTDTFLGTYQATGTQSKSIYGIGHSLLGNDMDILTLTRRVVETAGYSATTKEQNQPGSPLQWNWDHSDDGYHNDGRYVDIPTGVYDQLIMVENSGVQEGGTGGSITAAGLWRDLGLSSYADFPDCQAWLFTTWNDRTGSSPDPTWRSKFNHISTWGPSVVSGVNANNSASPPMQLIPLGPTYMAALYDDIYTPGSAIYNSGLTNIAQVFSDTVHLNTIGRYFQALVFASHIYGMDVRGANIAYLDRYGGSMPTPHPTSSQATALQNLVYSIWSS